MKQNDSYKVLDLQPGIYYMLSPQEAEARGSQVQGQPGLHSKTCLTKHK
jgi:hypothetical protein